MTYTQVLDVMQNKVSDQIIKRDEDGAFIPTDPDNVDYQAYLAWVEAGNKAKPYKSPPAAKPAQKSPAKYEKKK